MNANNIFDIFSEKYGVHGRIEDYGFVIKLNFTYEDREHTIGISRPFRKELSEVGLRIMETTIEKLLGESHDVFLHYWYVNIIQDHMVAHGIVTGHRRMPDTITIHTSPILGIEIDNEQEDAIITTQNTVYRCPLQYCKFMYQDENPELIPDYEALKAKYTDKIEYPEIAQGKVLLVLSDFDDSYFHSLCVKDENGNISEYRAQAHIGTFQDSFLIFGKELRIDIRYFPHYKNIEFYSMDTAGMPLYAENIGNSVIYITDMHRHKYKLKPGERKKIVKENADDDIGDLPDGDYYPVPIIG